MKHEVTDVKQRRFFRLSRGGALLGAAATLAGLSIASHAQAPERNVWTGVYTAAQAESGKTQYEQYCASCHGPTLAGGDSAPPLVGGSFLNNWNTLSAGEFHDRVKSTMPANDPGSLSNKAVAEIEAYIFQVNGFPAGSVALPNDPQMMANVKITATKPAG